MPHVTHQCSRGPRCQDPLGLWRWKLIRLLMSPPLPFAVCMYKCCEAMGQNKPSLAGEHGIFGAFPIKERLSEARGGGGGATPRILGRQLPLPPPQGP